MSDPGEITILLKELSEAATEEQHRRAIERLMPQVYGELKMLARANRVRWEGHRYPGTTSLVHEAYVKLAGDEEASFPSRGHFFALASRAMRSILVDNARRLQRTKRGGGVEPLEFDEGLFVSARRSAELLALDDALKELEEQRPQLARIVECRCFGGLTIEETAAALDVSKASVKRRWTLARTWLFRELRSTAPGTSAAR
jgi:RNA polymerase sigma factor (TIGR02999 family)